MNNGTKHCMIDIETLGQTSHSVVLSVAAAVFIKKQEEFVSTFTAQFTVCDQLNMGREVNWDTLKWWVQQDKVREIWLRQPTSDTKTILCDLAEWYMRCGAEHVWSHGATFDVVILDDFFKQFNIPTPWKFRDVRDTRTLYGLFPDQETLKATFRHLHDPMEDVIDQINAWHLCMGYIDE